MSFLKNILRNAVSDGVSKGIRDAVSSAAEKIVAPIPFSIRISEENTLYSVLLKPSMIWM